MNRDFRLKGYLLRNFLIVLVLIGIFQALVDIFLGDTISGFVENTLNLQGMIEGRSVSELWSYALKVLLIFLTKTSVGVVLEICDAILGADLLSVVDSSLDSSIAELTRNMTGDEIGMYFLKILLMILVLVVIWTLPFILGAIFFTLTASKRINAVENERLEKEREFERQRNLLLSDVAHDIKTPVTTVAGFSKALADGEVPEEKRQEYMNAVYVKSMQVGNLVSLLFEYVKLDSAGFELKKTTVDICEMVRESIARMYTDFEGKNMELCLDIPEEAVKCEIDPVQTERAIGNLLNNSIRHNPEGTTVMVGLSEQNGSVVIDISDNGNRIDKETAAHLFDPFVQGDQSRVSGSGSGLGLSIAKKIIDMQGGQIVLYQYSDPEKYGKVKTFRVTLPI